MYMRFGTWNVRNLYKAGSLMTVSRELARYKLDLWECKRSDGRAVTPNLWEKRIISEFKRVEFVSDRMSCIILTGRWCHVVLNVHAATEDKTYDVKDSFYEELERMFGKFPKYHMKFC
jgi:hypothetical protein